MGQKGVTLIELMIALGVFAVIGILSYRALNQASTTEQRIAGELTRWRQIARVFQFMQNDFSQVVPTYFGVATSNATGGAAFPVFLSVGAQASELQLTVFDRGEARRIAYRFGSQRLEWLRWGGRVAVGEAEREELLAGIRDVRWRFLYMDRWSDSWPTGNTAALPDAVEVTLELDDTGPLVKRYALH
jgi:general secretion pathway protein J